jgi:hypothetical protein
VVSDGAWRCWWKPSGNADSRWQCARVNGESQPFARDNGMDSVGYRARLQSDKIWEEHSGGWRRRWWWKSSAKEDRLGHFLVESGSKWLVVIYAASTSDCKLTEGSPLRHCLYLRKVFKEMHLKRVFWSKICRWGCSFHKKHWTWIIVSQLKATSEVKVISA